MTEQYNHSNADEIAKLFVGRRIVTADLGPCDYPDRGWHDRPEGRLVLDDGTILYLAGNDGGCACSAGCYPLEKVATVANVITSARVEADPHGDGDYERDNGAYRIFVFADAAEINVAEFVGSDGNGYYGTGFALTVIRPENPR